MYSFHFKDSSTRETNENYILSCQFDDEMYNQEDPVHMLVIITSAVTSLQPVRRRLPLISRRRCCSDPVPARDRLRTAQLRCLGSGVKSRRCAEAAPRSRASNKRRAPSHVICISPRRCVDSHVHAARQRRANHAVVQSRAAVSRAPGPRPRRRGPVPGRPRPLVEVVHVAHARRVAEPAAPAAAADLLPARGAQPLVALLDVVAMRARLVAVDDSAGRQAQAGGGDALRALPLAHVGVRDNEGQVGEELTAE